MTFPKLKGKLTLKGGGGNYNDILLSYLVNYPST